jgi:hypothetical protein
VSGERPVGSATNAPLAAALRRAFRAGVGSKAEPNALCLWFVYRRARMTSLASQLRRASVELAHFEKQLAKLEARTAGKRVEVAKLQAAMARDQGTRPARSSKRPRRSPAIELPPQRTDAIVAVLGRSAAPMSPSEITEALREGGREEEPRSVSATLAHLLKAKRVQRVGRGRYLPGV